MAEIVIRPGPSALPPTEAELGAWHALSRDQQLLRLRDILLSPEAEQSGAATMDQVLEAAREHVAARRG